MAVDINKVYRWLDLITYKPGYKFSVDLSYNGTHSFVYLRISVDAPCSDTGIIGPVHSVHAIDPEMLKDPELFVDFVYIAIHQLETHEMNEFFKVGGVKVKDPHAETPPKFPIDLFQNAKPKQEKENAFKKFYAINEFALAVDSIRRWQAER